MTGTASDAFSTEHFVEGIHDVVYKAAVRDAESLIAHPPGRNPRRELVELSVWWRTLQDSDREMVRSALTMTSDLAVFGLLCVLDNSRPVTNTPGVSLSLQAVVDGVTYQVPHDEAVELHDLFASLVEQEREE